MVSPHYQVKHAGPGGREAEGGGKVAALAPPHVFIAFQRWADGLTGAYFLIQNRNRGRRSPSPEETTQQDRPDLRTSKEINGWQGCRVGCHPLFAHQCPSKPANPVVRRCLQVWCQFRPRATKPHIAPLHDLKRENSIKQGVAQERLPFRHPAPSRHPFGPALTALSKRPPTPTVTGLRTRETPMPHLGSMPDPKDKPRTLLVGWISRLISRWSSACQSTRCAAGRLSALDRPACAPGGRSITGAPPSKSGWKSRSKPPRAAAVQEGIGDGHSTPSARLAH